MHVGDVGDACQHARAVGVAQTALHVIFCRIVFRIDGVDGREIPIQGQGVFHSVPFMHESLQGIERMSALTPATAGEPQPRGEPRQRFFKASFTQITIVCESAAPEKQTRHFRTKLVTRRRSKATKKPLQGTPPNKTELALTQQFAHSPPATKARE